MPEGKGPPLGGLQVAAEHSWSRLQQEGSNETGLVSTVRRQNQHSLAPCLPTPIHACRLSFPSLGLMALSWQVGCVWGFPAVAEQRKMWVQFIMEMNWKSLMETDWIYRMFSAVLQGASAEARRGSVWQPGVCIGQRLGSSSSCCAQGSWSSGQQRGGVSCPAVGQAWRAAAGLWGLGVLMEAALQNRNTRPGLRHRAEGLLACTARAAPACLLPFGERNLLCRYGFSCPSGLSAGEQMWSHRCCQQNS